MLPSAQKLISWQTAKKMVAIISIMVTIVFVKYG